MESRSELRRTVGLGALTVYATGDILGAGIYALVGKVAGAAGGGAWLSFVVAAGVALISGLTYAELSSRYPLAAGASAYCRRAFAPPVVGFLAGIFVLASGVTSAAAVSRAFVGYLDTFIIVPPLMASLSLLVLMTALNFWGIKESVRVNLFLTGVEILGLLFVVGAGLWYASTLPAGTLGGRIELPLDPFDILTGATIAFFAYIGFEDTVNLAEEVHDPARVLPRAILIAVVVTTLIYVAVCVVALWTVPLATLAGSPTPLIEVVIAAGVYLPTGVFSAIALCAICNTGLLNLIMVSRLGYGMAREGLLPDVFGRVHSVRRTPHVSVAAAFVLAALLALSGDTRVLAQTTSFLLLCVFTALHVGLLVIKRGVAAPAGVFQTPAWTPAIGVLLCAGLCTQYPIEVYVRAGIVLAGGLALYVWLGRR